MLDQIKKIKNVVISEVVNIRSLYNVLLNSINFSSKKRECNLCGWSGFNFFPYGIGIKLRKEAQCPKCKSLERHRAVKFLASKDLENKLFDTLHVAPEIQITEWLRSISASYLSIDLFRPAMEKMDLTALKLEDKSKTLVFCSHVLEHIPDDFKAMSEIFRVLKPDGIAIVQVPIWQEKTYEDFSLTSKEERLKAFFQEDHVRIYGVDIKERLESVGFHVEIKTVDLLPVELIDKYSLSFKSTKEVFICRKP